MDHLPHVCAINDPHAQDNPGRARDVAKRERADHDSRPDCAYTSVRASDAPLIRDRQDPDCGGPASAALRGSTSLLSRKGFGP